MTEVDSNATAGMDDRDRHALLYIVVVLLFYSTGIVVAIVMYLKREKAEIEEEKAYDDYVLFTTQLRSDPDKWARYFRVQRMIAQLDRVERQAAEKQRQQREPNQTFHDNDDSRPPSRLNLTRKSPRLVGGSLSLLTLARKSPPRPGGHRGSSALKIFVFGSQSTGVHSAGVDPCPLLGSTAEQSSALKASRSAGGRLDIGCNQTANFSDRSLVPLQGLCRTHSCDVQSTGTAAGDADGGLQAERCRVHHELKRSYADSISALHVSTV